MKQIAKKHQQQRRNATARKLKASLAINKRWQNVKLKESLTVSTSEALCRPTESSDQISNIIPNDSNSVGLGKSGVLLNNMPSTRNAIDLTSNIEIGSPRPSSQDFNNIACPTESSLTNNKTLSLSTRMNDIVSYNMPGNNISKDFTEHEESVSSEYKLIDMICLKKLISNLACPSCFETTITVSCSEENGFASKLTIMCDNCADLDISTDTSTKIKDSKAFEVNRRIVKSFMSIGEGFGALEKFSLIMNMDGMSSKTYNNHSKLLAQSCVKINDLNLAKARARVREIYKEMDNSINNNTIIDIGVSYDGSWHKRGHTSNYGIGIMIELHTGLVIDYCVLSKYCQNCAITAKELGPDSPEFDIWFQGHKSECFKNYSGSSPAMETKSAEILWKRSLEYNFRYRTVLSDGDSAVYAHIQQLKVYGNNISIEKEECVNHVAKRLGTGLRNVVQTAKAKGITLGGRKFGSLKDTTITKLTKYYQKAILNNHENVPGMKQEILGTLHHCASTDSEPRHTKCPTGDKSWCFYNRAIAKGEEPGTHAENLGTAITPTVLRHIFPVYKRLMSKELLERCQKGRTQNANESLHSAIWKKCPKTRNVSMRIVQSAAAEGISEYNYGNRTQTTIMEGAKISPGKKTHKLIKARDRRRIAQSKKRSALAYKKYRRQLKMKKMQKEEKKKEKEGVTYGAGLF